MRPSERRGVTSSDVVTDVVLTGTHPHHGDRDGKGTTVTFKIEATNWGARCEGPSNKMAGYEEGGVLRGGTSDPRELPRPSPSEPASTSAYRAFITVSVMRRKEPHTARRERKNARAAAGSIVLPGERILFTRASRPPEAAARTRPVRSNSTSDGLRSTGAALPRYRESLSKGHPREHVDVDGLRRSITFWYA